MKQPYAFYNILIILSLFLTFTSSCSCIFEPEDKYGGMTEMSNNEMEFMNACGKQIRLTDQQSRLYTLALSNQETTTESFTHTESCPDCSCPDIEYEYATYSSAYTSELISLQIISSPAGSIHNGNDEYGFAFNFEINGQNISFYEVLESNSGFGNDAVIEVTALPLDGNNAKEVQGRMLLQKSSGIVSLSTIYGDTLRLQDN